MIYNVLEYLEQSARNYPNKVAFDDDKQTYTFGETVTIAKSIGSYLSAEIKSNFPIAILMDKTAMCLPAFFGVVYSGCFYVPIDCATPSERIVTILDTLKPAMIITDRTNVTKLGNTKFPVVIFEEIKETPIDEKALERIRNNMVDTDLLYVLFTSGSTGVPKGVTISHKSVIDYTEWLMDTFEVDEKTTFGNQAPFYFDNSVLDIYLTLAKSAYMYIIPKVCFSFPKRMIEKLNEKQINTIFWVPSALVNLANSGILSENKLEFIKNIYFCGEVMPCKQLNVFIENYPNVTYCNMYGPTEITDVCTYFMVNRKFNDDDMLPIGIPCKNTKILIINEKDEQCQSDEQGEICILGTCLSFGYYGDFEKSSKVFVQNPLNDKYYELMYRTGDLGRYNEYGEIMFEGRKDYQIKHQGHRIELGEIETSLLSLEGLDNGCCLYDDNISEIICVYCGDIDKNEITLLLMDKLPKYMIPTKFIKLDAMPQNQSGKIDQVC